MYPRFLVFDRLMCIAIPPSSDMSEREGYKPSNSFTTDADVLLPKSTVAQIIKQTGMTSPPVTTIVFRLNNIAIKDALKETLKTLDF